MIIEIMYVVVNNVDEEPFWVRIIISDWVVIFEDGNYCQIVVFVMMMILMIGVVVSCSCLMWCEVVIMIVRLIISHIFIVIIVVIIIGYWINYSNSKFK